MSQPRFDGSTLNAGQDAVQLVGRWLDVPSVARLVGAFGGAPPSGSLSERLSNLAGFTNQWDYRKGKERTGIQRAQFTIEQQEAVKEAARELGLGNTPAPNGASYDGVVVLGGTLLACVARVRLVRGLLESGVRSARVYLLGTQRVPAESEFAALEHAGETLPRPVDDEFEMLCLLAERELQTLRSGPARTDESGELRSYTGRGTTVDVLSTIVHGRRATTGDTYQHLQTHASFHPGSHLLVCTTQIYVPFQFFDAIRLLAIPHSLSIEFVGVPAVGPLHQAENYLQEIRSAVLSANKLVDFVEHGEARS